MREPITRTSNIDFSGTTDINTGLPLVIGKMQTAIQLLATDQYSDVVLGNLLPLSSEGACYNADWDGIQSWTTCIVIYSADEFYQDIMAQGMVAIAAVESFFKTRKDHPALHLMNISLSREETERKACRCSEGCSCAEVPSWKIHIRLYYLANVPN